MLTFSCHQSCCWLLLERSRLSSCPCALLLTFSCHQSCWWKALGYHGAGAEELLCSKLLLPASGGGRQALIMPSALRCAACSEETVRSNNQFEWQHSCCRLVLARLMCLQAHQAITSYGSPCDVILS